MGTKFSGITPATQVPATADRLVGVTAGNVDLLYTLSQIAGGLVAAGIVTITDAASQAFNANNGVTTVARQSATADRTLIAPINAVDGQKVIIEFFASGAGRTLTLTTGSVGSFRFGTDIVAPLTQTAISTTDRIGLIYNAAAARWDVIAYVKGF